MDFDHAHLVLDFDIPLLRTRVLAVGVYEPARLGPGRSIGQKSADLTEGLFDGCKRLSQLVDGCIREPGTRRRPESGKALSEKHVRGRTQSLSFTRAPPRLPSIPVGCVTCPNRQRYFRQDTIHFVEVRWEEPRPLILMWEEPNQGWFGCPRRYAYIRLEPSGCEGSLSGRPKVTKTESISCKIFASSHLNTQRLWALSSE
jgi:hypothetical protein